MAIIPRYTSRVLPPGAQPGLITGARSRGEAGAGLARAFGGAVVEGIDYARRRDEATKTTAAETTAAANLARRTAAEKRRAENLDHRNGETTLAAAEAEITKGRARAVASAKTGGAPARDMARISLADFDDTTRKQAEALKTRPHLKARFDAMVESSRAPHELRMLTLENERRASEEKAVLAAALGGLARAAADDPAMAPGVTGRGLAQIEAAMDAGMVTPEEAAAMQGEFADNVHMAAMRGQIAADPALALEKLESGELDDIFEAPARDRLLGEARTTVRVKQAGAASAARARRRGLELDMAVHLAALDETGAGDEAVAARALAELPETEYAAFQAAEAGNRERHATRQEYAFLTPQEIEADIAQKAPGGDLSDSDERDAAHAIRAETRDEILAARAADPAGWAMRDEGVAAAHRAAQENPDDPALARQAAEQRLALQREMGVEQPRLFSEPERDAIAAQLAEATPTDRPAIIAGLRERYGEHAGMLAAELAGEVDANTALLLAHADMPHLPRLIAQGMAKSAKDGPASLKMARPEDVGLLPALPIIAKGEQGGRKLDMTGMKPGQHYRTADGGVMLYDGEALVLATVELVTPNPANPNAPPPPLPLGKASPERETAVKGIAHERDEQGNPVAASGGENTGGHPEAEFDSEGGFWAFELPLNADGSVNEGVLKPGSVYRIPESAGGGTGQWKNGTFYNFDWKADWRIRNPADLDAYSGVSGEPTPEEHRARKNKELDDTFMPAALLDEEAIQEFSETTGYGLTRGEGGLTLTDPSGRELINLAEEDAAELARIWSPEIAGQIATMGLLWREDLTPEEKRKIVAEATGADKLGPAPKYISGRVYAAHAGRNADRRLIEFRMKAYDDLAAAMERDASDEEIGDLLENFQAAMLPEVFRTERFIREFLMDVVPGLGNVRSFRHLENDIAEVERAIETGEWGDAAWAGGMAILDGIGIFPGGNLLKGAGKLAGRGLVKAVPHLDGLLAERTIRRFKAQWGKTVGKVEPRRFVGELLDELDPKIRKKFAGLVNDRVGSVSENELLDLGKRMDPNALPEVGKKVPGGFQIETRIYDMEATFLSDVIAAKNATLGRLARWIANAGDEAAAGTKVERKQFELKTGDKKISSREGDPDKFYKEHPDSARKDYDVNEVIYLRRPPEEVSIDFVIDDLSQYLDDWVADGRLDVAVARELKGAMNRIKAKGIKTFGLEEYVDLLARIGAATSRQFNMNKDGAKETNPDTYQ